MYRIRGRKRFRAERALGGLSPIPLILQEGLAHSQAVAEPVLEPRGADSQASALSCTDHKIQLEKEKSLGQ